MKSYSNFGNIKSVAIPDAGVQRSKQKSSFSASKEYADEGPQNVLDYQILQNVL